MASTQVRIAYDPATYTVLMMVIPDDDAELIYHIPPLGASVIDIPQTILNSLTDQSVNQDDQNLNSKLQSVNVAIAVDATDTPVSLQLPDITTIQNNLPDLIAAVQVVGS